MADGAPSRRARADDDRLDHRRRRVHGVLLVDAVGLLRRRDPAARRAFIPIAAGALAFLAAAALRVASGRLHGGARLAARSCRTTSPRRASSSRSRPSRKPYFFFWNSNVFLAWEPFRRVAVPVSVALAAWLFFVLSRRREAAILFGVGTLGLMGLFGLVYGGDVRHHGFLFVLC